MTGIKLCPEGLQHTMTRVVGRRISVRHNSNGSIRQINSWCKTDLTKNRVVEIKTYASLKLNKASKKNQMADLNALNLPFTLQIDK
jgi:TusA-related sulfurtransferase